MNLAIKRMGTFLLAAICLAAVAASWFQGRSEYKKQTDQMDIRAASLANGAQESIRSRLAPERRNELQDLLERLTSQGAIYGIATCFRGGHTAAFPRLPEWDSLCQRTGETGNTWNGKIARAEVQINRVALPNPVEPGATLLVAQSLKGAKRAFRESFARTFFLVLLSAAGILFLIASQVRLWLKGYAFYLYRSMRTLARGGRNARRPQGFAGLPPDMDQLTAKILTLPIRNHALVIPPPALDSNPLDANPLSNPLATSLRSSLEGRELVIIANREPYIHRQKGDDIEVIRPASGLVTALEPVLRSCGGLWIGHGSGDADRKTSDTNGELRVPPESPSYTLKRVWLTSDEEKGYYYGFANEGLWPLCHHAHHRPIFRLTDWETYSDVNRKFAYEIPDRVLNERSLILVQDYHFALLPKQIKERAPNAGVSLFWHIPWPNPEAFGICPWGQELLEGMLGADVIGFHTQFHCNNFLETCDRYLEARIDWERFSVIRGDHETLVRPFPIGIATPLVDTLTDTEVKALKAKYGVQAEFVAVGVDRIDYTKGLVERIESVGRFLEKNPEYVGNFTLLQMGSPSRTSIPAYRLLTEELEEVVRKVNERFAGQGPEGWLPIRFIAEHHEWDDIRYFYQLGDVCMVTSLHDGMNLVAKEYVWCQRADRGSLILSKFTGASRELTEAYLVNPYSIEDTSDAIAAALALSPAEKALRMNAMKEKIRNHNAFHWATELIQTLIQETARPEDEKELASSGLSWKAAP